MRNGLGRPSSFLTVLMGSLPCMCGSDAFVAPLLLPPARVSSLAARSQCYAPSALVPSSSVCRLLPPVQQRIYWSGGRGRVQVLLPTASSSGVNGQEGELEGGVRVNKCFKEFASRRESDRMVADGRVMVNGKIATMGERVFPGDKVTLDGMPVQWESLAIVDELARPEEQFVYIKYWKPVGVSAIPSGFCFPAHSFAPKVFMVGRLDKDSSGLILLTSDGRLPNTVLRSGQRHDKRYVVQAHREVSDQDLATLASGVVITTVAQRDRTWKPLTAPTLPCKVERLDDRTLTMILQEGRNRQIRKMMEALGYRVVDLHRESVMGIGLQGLRGPGDWCALNKREMGLVTRALQSAGD